MSKEKPQSVADIAMKYAELVSQAAANKAAEEGGRMRDEYNLPELPERPKSMMGQTMRYGNGDMEDYACAAIAADRASRQPEPLSMEPVPRMLRAGRALHEQAKILGWQDDGEGAFEYVQRMSYELGKEHGKEHGSASRHVASRTDAFANKAEVIRQAAWVDESGRLQPHGAFSDAPPATTGASTVLTDERISALWLQSERHYDFARAIEREVAAQAGQVVVPDLMRQAVATVVSRAGDNLRIGWLRPERCDVGTLLYCAAPSPAKESK